MTPKPRAILYARFSPRPLPATCTCGHQFRVEATEGERILAVCPSCKGSLVVRNSESCDSQLAELRQWCRARRHPVAGAFSDRALSGGDDWADRPGMFDAVAAAKRGMIFIVRSFDRLFRDTRKGLMFATDLERKGVKLLSITEEAASLDTPEAQLMRAILLAMAEYQRQMSRARTRAKMLEHQRNGRKMSAQPPYGTKVDPANPKRLLPSPAEQAVILKVREMRAEKLSLRQIARSLERQGIPRRGKKTWTHQLVKSILQRAGSAGDLSSRL